MVQFKASIHEGFDKSIEKKLKTMQSIKKSQWLTKRKYIYDIKTLFPHLIAVGFQWNLNDIFQYAVINRYWSADA